MARKCKDWILWGDVYTPGTFLAFDRGPKREILAERRWRENLHTPPSGTWLVRRCQVRSHQHPWTEGKRSPNE